MKSQRRHELKENSLIRNLRLLPAIGKQYQNQIALGLVLAALAVILVRYRINSSHEQITTAQTSLSQAADDLRELKGTVSAPQSIAALAVNRRNELYADGIKQANQVLETAPQSQNALKAQALLYKGDLNLTLANFPEYAGAATEPSLRPAEAPEDLLANAEAAYNQVLKDFGDNLLAVTEARFSLAAVAEDRAAANPQAKDQWDAAAKQYQAILDGNAPAVYKDLARQRLQLLPQLQQRTIVGLAPRFTLPPETTMPSTRPIPLGPGSILYLPTPSEINTTMPSTQATTRGK